MTPLLLVAGMLGAGKTTFLRSLLPALTRRGLRARVVLNDFRNARVDGATLADIAPDLLALDGDCLCCETLTDLLDALAGMSGQRGEVVVVEANGATDTGPLLELVGGDRRLDHLSPPLQHTVVDARRHGERGWQNVMEAEQIATATHLSLSRTDLVSPERRAQVAAALARQVPHARPVDAESLADVLVDLEASVRDLPARSPLLAALAAGSTGPQPPAGSDDGAHAQAHANDHAQAYANAHAHAQHPHFAAVQLPLPRPVDAGAFQRFLDELPPEILRAKGIVELRDPPEKRSFQKVHDEAEISPCQLAEPETLETVAVFVGPRLPVPLLEAQVRHLMSDAPAPSAGNGRARGEPG